MTIFQKTKKIKAKVDNFLYGGTTYSVEEFFQMYQEIKKVYWGKIEDTDTSGCYLLQNLTHGKNYVGQSVHVLKRVNSHFTGKGNGDVYANYKYGANFTITIIKCSPDELNQIERELIRKYKAFGYGYNKNRGNRKEGCVAYS